MKKYLTLSAFVLSSLLGTLPATSLAAGVLSLSQTSVLLNVGQNTTVTILPPANQLANISSISNTYVALANVSNNVVTIYGLSAGSTQIALCTYDSTCGSIFVTVGSGTGSSDGTIMFSQNNLNLALNQTASVTVFVSNGATPYISTPAPQNIVSASFSGNTLNLTGLNTGTTTITICASSNACNYLYVTVNNSSSVQIGLSQTSALMNIGDYLNITVTTSALSPVYISNNSNSNVVASTLSNTLITLHALSAGSAVITVCAANASCTNLNVTVSGSNNLTFSQSSVGLALNQTAYITIYSSLNSSFYISGNTNPTVVTASIAGNQLSVFGQNTGSSIITVCQNGNACGTVSAAVSQANSGMLYFTTTTLPQPIVNQNYSGQLYVTGGTAPYSFLINSGSLPAGLYLSGSGLISGIPANTTGTSFTVKVSDTYGRIGISPVMYLNPTGNVLGISLYNNGTLINDNGTIYITYKNTKSAFTNAGAFTGLGYSFANVISADSSNLYNSGYLITSANTAHPWGSWVKNGATIYFVDSAGLIPIPSFDIFTTNGGTASQVVNMNSYDFYKPTLPVMAYSDSRLR